jgi:hypothetical protein
VKEHAFNQARSLLSHGKARYGLICHSKYISPTTNADTTTRCMNGLPYQIVVLYLALETNA